MKGIICYYSGSGNTKLACQYIAKKIKSVEFDLCNIVKDDKPDLNEYDLVGFATWADFMGAPQLFHSFIEKMELKTDKPAFVFNTYGAMSGKTLRDMENTVKSKGFNVICGYSLHTPENYPPSITKGRDFRNSPNKRSLEKFDAFITGLENILVDLKQNKILQQTKIKLGLLNSIMPKFPRTKAREDMGGNLLTKLCAMNAVSVKNGVRMGQLNLIQSQSLIRTDVMDAGHVIIIVPRKQFIQRRLEEKDIIQNLMSNY